MNLLNDLSLGHHHFEHLHSSFTTSKTCFENTISTCGGWYDSQIGHQVGAREQHDRWSWSGNVALSISGNS